MSYKIVERKCSGCGRIQLVSKCDLHKLCRFCSRKIICSRPEYIEKQRLSHLNKHYLPATGFKKGQIPHNKGTKGLYSTGLFGNLNPASRPEVKEKIKGSILKLWDNLDYVKKCKKGRDEYWKTHSHWKKGLTKETDERIKVSSDKMKGRTFSNETREKMSLAKAIAIEKGEFNPYSNCKRGYFYSKKNNKELWYQSSYELLAYQILETMITVKNYAVYPFKILYEYNGTKHYYIVDLFVEYTNGEKQLIEVKDSWRLKDPLTQCKIEAGKKFAEEQGMRFEVWDEYRIFVQHVDKAVEK